MTFSAPSFLTGKLSAFEELALTTGDQRPHPEEDALVHAGNAVMNELLDLLQGTALEDYTTTIAEALIGGFHSAQQRIERDADKARDEMNRLLRDFDGSEIADSEIQEATAKARAADVAAAAVEFMRDSAAATYTTATGEVWSPWRGSTRGSRITAAQIDAKDAIRASRARKSADVDPGSTVIAFRGSPAADTVEDANRIFDALNWALRQYPEMTLATTGASGAEKIAIRWAQQKNVKMILARPDFDKDGRAAPFRANDAMIEFDPILCLTLANTLNPEKAATLKPSGVALNLAQKAAEKGIRHLAITARQ